jgi:serine protease inhibitor
MIKKSNIKKKERNIGRYMVLFVSSIIIIAFFSPHMEKLVQTNTQFAIDLYEQIKIEEGNLFFSPYSISTVLALLYGGARGETAKQMADVIRGASFGNPCTQLGKEVGKTRT